MDGSKSGIYINTTIDSLTYAKKNIGVLISVPKPIGLQKLHH
jgi:hypothetical protein